MAKPLVSICIPTYNGDQYITEALNSAINQTYRPLEIILSDDASSDKTLAIAETFAKRLDVDIKIVHHTPSGIGANWNNCIKNSSGEYVKLLFQDDVLHPECIEQMVDFAIKNKNQGLYFCKRKLIGDVGKGILLDKPQQNFSEINETNFLLKDTQLFRFPRNKIGEPTVTLIPKETFNKIGYFREDLVQVLDFEFWLRVSHNFPMGFLNMELVQFRIHANQTTALNRIRTVKDEYKLPWLIIRDYFFILKFKVKLLIIYKFWEGLWKFYL